MHGRDDRCIQEFVSKYLKGRDHSENLGMDGKIISEWKGWEGMDLIHLVQDRKQW
jgi:hypothetical protein